MAVVKVQHGSSKGLAWQYVKFCVAAACVQETIPDMFWPRQRVNNLIEKPSKFKKTL